MDEIMHNLDKFIGIDEDWFNNRFWEMKNISGALMAKYLTGTPLAETVMMNLPYLRGTFYDSYSFPPNTHASVGGNSINNLAELKKLSEKTMDSYQFVNQLRNAVKGQTITEKSSGYQR